MGFCSSFSTLGAASRLILSVIASVTVMSNASLPAPEPNEQTKIVSPGFAMSSVAARPMGDAPE